MICRTVLAVLLAATMQGAAPDRVPIFLKGAGTTDGFTDPSQDRRDSVRDLMKRLKDSDIVRIVARAADAEVVIEVVDRSTRREINVWGAQNRSALVVRLTAGDYATEFTGESGSKGVFTGYGGAAKSVVRQIEAWVRANRQKLTAAK